MGYAIIYHVNRININMNPEKQNNMPIESLGYYSMDMEQKTPEEREIILDQMLEAVFSSEAAVKINEGNNGVILELDTTDLPAEVRDYFLTDLEDEGDDDDKIAVKLLKIYTGTEGRKEYELQKKARNILKAEDIEGVKVPKPRKFRELEINNDDVAKHLESLGVKIGKDRIVEIIAMDLVAGQDLATIMYEAYVKNHEADFKAMYPDLELESYLEQINIDALIDLVHKMSGIKSKYNNLDNSPAAVQERAQIAKAISQGIAYKSVLDKKHASGLLEAVNALHAQGLYHRDLHPRNVMVDNDGNLEIIDFGLAKEIDPKNSLEVKSVYVAGPESSYLSDQGIINIAQQLAKTEADLKVEQRISRLGDPETLLNRLAARKPEIWQDFIKDINDNQDIGRILGLYENKFGGTNDHKVRVALLLEISKQNKKSEVIDFLKATIEKENERKKEYRSDFLINQYQSLLDFLS